jgi:hypothetical protein
MATMLGSCTITYYEYTWELVSAQVIHVHKVKVYKKYSINYNQ